MDSLRISDGSFHFDSVRDETPADLAEAMDFFLADIAAPLTAEDIDALCEMEAARNLDILHEVALLRINRVALPVFPVALTA